MSASSEDGLAVVLGAGPVGRALVDRLVEEGQRVRVATRSGTATVPEGVDVVAADISHPADALRACSDASVVYGCVGLDYREWPELWPPMMEGMLVGAEAADSRFVFVDNCYMYGPVDEPMHEDLPLTDYGRKPATRSRLTRMWQTAHDAGRVEAAAVRASDFYGPGVSAAALGDYSVGRMARGKSAQVVGDPDQPHSFTYVPDIARALVAVGESDDAMGQAWNVPNAPDRTVRDVLGMFAQELGRELKLQATPRLLVSAMGLFNPNMREMKEMLYQWERPFHVDSSKFAGRFWSDATELHEGVAATVRALTRPGAA
ncbi:MAG: NAD-dependent epimerase/dehydratase family protein [Thermoleophilia bacterium]|nr:NAD-dependent epimerase/dehydratase family protein [Thermoleophilia bacterium]